MQWLLSDLEKEGVFGHSDLMVQLTTTGQKGNGTGNGSGSGNGYGAQAAGYAVPLSARQSFSSMAPLSER